jgi:hypothetical protein
MIVLRARAVLRAGKQNAATKTERRAIEVPPAAARAEGVHKIRLTTEWCDQAAVLSYFSQLVVRS